VDREWEWEWEWRGTCTLPTDGMLCKALCMPATDASYGTVTLSPPNDSDSCPLKGVGDPPVVCNRDQWRAEESGGT